MFLKKQQPYSIGLESVSDSSLADTPDVFDDVEEDQPLVDLDKVFEAIRRKRKKRPPLWQLAAECGNRHVPTYLRKRKISFDREFVARLRLQEHAHIVRHIERWVSEAFSTANTWDNDDPNAIELTAQAEKLSGILRKLTGCRIGMRSGLMFSLLCRAEKEKRHYADLCRLFSGVPDDHMRFETLVLAMLSGTASEITQQAQIEMTKFRTLMNNFLRGKGENRAARRRIMKMGWFEIEPYDVDHLLDVRDAYIDAKRNGRPIKKSLLRGYRKVRLMKRLGAKLVRSRWGSGTVWCLHYHAVTNIEDHKFYVKGLEKLLPGKRRILVKRLYRTLSRIENFRRLSGYELKASPTFGRVDRPKTRGSRLAGDNLVKFVEIYAALGFRGMKANFNTGAD